jgi:hypothetical protein
VEYAKDYIEENSLDYYDNEYVGNVAFRINGRD